MNGPRWTILVVDDHESTRQTVADAVKGHNAEALTAATAAEAREVFKDNEVDVVIMDLKLPDGDGLDLLDEFHRHAGQVPIVLITGHGSEDIAVNAIRRGAHDYIPKPVGLHRLRAVLEGALRTRSLYLENLALHRQIDARQAFRRIVGHSEAVREIIDTIRQVAPTNASILITGENGTGKELVADAVHAASDRAGRPFVKVAVPALPRDLLESELFGHEKGAFTGAFQSRKGRFELAHGGTLFLDEIGDMPYELQAKLLRVIESRQFDRVGGTETMTVDIRLICATNRDLWQMVQEGKFREDLYYRINVITIALPPLRERQEDVPLLANHFLDEFASPGSPKKTLTEKAMEVLTAYDWPGNVRELRNLIERLVIVVPGGEIDAQHLPSYVRRSGDASPAPSGGGLEEAFAGRALEEIERISVLATLKATGGNKTAAAKSLGIGLKTLYRKLEAYRKAGYQIPEDN